MRGRVIIRLGLSAVVALLLMAGTAFAQSPADTVYNNNQGEVLNVVQGGGPSGPSGVAGESGGSAPAKAQPRESGAGTPATTTAAATSGSSLPFTGFQAGLVALAGMALVGTGFAMRRVARSEA
jgi:hypothetical protein